MKKIILGLFIFFMGITVRAYSSITVENVVDAINAGNVTNAFINLENGKGNVVSIKAMSISDGLSIVYEVSGEKKYSGEYRLKKDNNILKYEKEYNLEDYENNPYILNVASLIPLWGFEATNVYSKVIEHKSEDEELIHYLNGIFNTCDITNRGVCYTDMPYYGKRLLKAEIELTTKSGEYALSFVNEKQKEEKDKNKYILLIGVAIVLFLLIYTGVNANKKRTR